MLEHLQAVAAPAGGRGRRALGVDLRAGVDAESQHQVGVPLAQHILAHDLPVCAQGGLQRAPRHGQFAFAGDVLARVHDLLGRLRRVGVNLIHVRPAAQVVEIVDELQPALAAKQVVLGGERRGIILGQRQRGRAEEQDVAVIVVIRILLPPLGHQVLRVAFHQRRQRQARLAVGGAVRAGDRLGGAVILIEQGVGKGVRVDIILHCPKAQTHHKDLASIQRVKTAQPIDLAVEHVGGGVIIGRGQPQRGQRQALALAFGQESSGHILAAQVALSAVARDDLQRHVRLRHRQPAQRGDLLLDALALLLHHRTEGHKGLSGRDGGGRARGGARLGGGRALRGGAGGARRGCHIHSRRERGQHGAFDLSQRLPGRVGELAQQHGGSDDAGHHQHHRQPGQHGKTALEPGLGGFGFLRHRRRQWIRRGLSRGGFDRFERQGLGAGRLHRRWRRWSGCFQFGQRALRGGVGGVNAQHLAQAVGALGGRIDRGGQPHPRQRVIHILLDGLLQQPARLGFITGFECLDALLGKVVHAGAPGCGDGCTLSPVEGWCPEPRRRVVP